MLLRDATATAGGGKAGALGTLVRAGLPVPDAFVIPFDAWRDAVRRLDLPTSPHGPGAAAARRAIADAPLDPALVEAIARGLERLGDPPVAVRSSAAGEDTAHASAAGAHESVLAVRGVAAVADAVRACWASLLSARALAYWDAAGPGLPAGDPEMAVLVQRLVDAEVSGVLFTPDDDGDATRIEASWGLGPSVVGGTVTPDAYLVAAGGEVTSTIADKRTRQDRRGTRLVVSDVRHDLRHRPALDHATVTRLAGLGHAVADALGGPQDVEWALADGEAWILQARPVTAAPPRGPAVATERGPAVLTGTPGSHGSATGTARVVTGPDDFSRVAPGDVLVCPWTDPAWTPLLRIAAGVVTETGGVLSHAAIVARERRIPAVLAVADATTRIRDGGTVTVDGTAGTVTTLA